MALLIFLLLLFQSSHSRLFCNNWYPIESGDSCWKISKEFNVTVDNLSKWNENLNCDNLWIGQKICVGTSENQPKCVKNYTTQSGDYCFKIWSQNNLTEAEFKSYNPDLDCDHLMLGQEVCLGIEKEGSDPGRGSLPMYENDLDNCGEFVIVKQNDTCWSISKEYALNLTEIEHKYNCDLIVPGDTICISENQTCQFRYQIKNETDTCSKISQIFKTTNFEIEEYNSDINCTSESLEIGRRICVWPIEERELANVTCTEYQKRDGSSLFQLARQNSISIDELMFLNPNFDQEDDICVKSNSTVKCASFEFIQSNDTCDIIIQRNQMSMKRLMTLNPTLRCDSLNITKEVCTGTGYFEANECVNTIRVGPHNDRCHKISNSTSISIERIEFLNKGINCSESAQLEWSILVCISSLGMKTETAQQTIVEKLGAKDTNLNKSYQEYLKNPNDETSQNMNQQIMESIGNETVHEELKELYRTDENIRIILDNQSPLSRDDYCEQVRKSTFSDKIKSCFCSSDDLLIYCQALARNEYLSTINLESVDTTFFARYKRCEINWPGSGTGIFENIESYASDCFGADCTIPVELVELTFEGNICVPFVKYASDTLTTCLRDRNDCRSSKDVGENYLKELSTVSTELSASVCVIGSKLLRTLKIVSSGICWNFAQFEYTPFVGIISFSTKLSLVITSFKFDIKIKATDMPFPSMCDMGAFECEDYCKMRTNGWENGRMYSEFEVRMLDFFGWSGIPVFEQKFNDPRILGCQAGYEAAIVLRNERSCANEEENVIRRRCWSGDDTIPWGELEPENGFSFKPKLNTLFVCEFVDSNDQKIGFDVYGGKSKQKGKKTFYYAVKNDGIYFGRNKGEESDLKGSWNKPCSEKNVEDEIQALIEPTGTSSVPAASCGKRIVGYYTGWGDREITEDQLRKLTHVIFAFVELEENQNLKFGKVSVDDSSDTSDSRAESRFLDMTRKARKVESGVNVLFAIGGWDNSQYFSSSCSNSESRSRLVDNIIKFIDMYNIDGIDIDWEYPNIDGGDKDNHVQFMKEIREKLDDLQQKKGRKHKYVITMATAAGEWNLRKGYDFDNLLKYVDFLNIMTYDYYGAWESKWGAYTGPPSPLYYGTLDGFSGKLNTDFTMKYYSCKTKKSQQLSMGIPFYGRYWDNVLGAINGTDGMWRTAEEKNGKFEGGFVGWRNLERQGWNKGASIWHDKTKTPYILNSGARKFLGYENERSIGEKINYAIDKNIGGLMVWALDLDDDSDTLLSLVSSADLCSAANQSPYNCVPIDDVRWWTPENSDESKQGQCGKSAPLINGYYPVCDPDDPGYACCGPAGYCGTGEKYCDCKTCLNYRKDPQLILKEPIKPSRDIEWFTSEDGVGKQGRCGKDAPHLSNGKIAICNPDDDSKYCCSNGGYCGIGKEYCECDGCVNYRKQ